MRILRPDLLLGLARIPRSLLESVYSSFQEPFNSLFFFSFKESCRVSHTSFFRIPGVCLVVLTTRLILSFTLVSLDVALDFSRVVF